MRSPSDAYTNAPALVIDSDDAQFALKRSIESRPLREPRSFAAGLALLLNAGHVGPITSSLGRSKSPAALEREARIRATERKFGYDRGGSYRRRREQQQAA
jgi:hypothetical protein